jgi:UDP-N-acetylmuramoyl-L-alanyl-D-glutamate--2,6-diaminopimelate ligase
LLTEELLAELPVWQPMGNLPAEVSGVVGDSRRVTPGDVFVAIPGMREDGHRYVEDARRRGAVLVVGEKPWALGGGPAVVVPDSREALALLAAAMAGHPSKEMRLLGVTGTNGKTSTTYLLASILKASGRRTAVVGTVGVFVDGERQSLEHTTPDAADLQPLLRRLRQRGAQAVVMEVSSHALELRRVVGCEFDGAVFTNLTQDHLDFHKTLARYRDAKLRLFQSLGGSYRGAPKAGPKWAAVNADDPSGSIFARRTSVPVVTFGQKRGEVRLTRIEPGREGTDLTLEGPFGRLEVHLSLVGRFYAQNALAAVAAAYAEGVDASAIVQGLEAAIPVPGRFEVIPGPWPFLVVVDYAHTPDGLRSLLAAARDLTPGRILLVFGAGGDRDRTKRGPMGEVAARGADLLVLTSDNPRSEDPERILDDLEAGVRAVGTTPFERITDRRAAIARALHLAQPGDTVLVAGKGHETYQIIGTEVMAFDDRQVVRDLLGGMGPW